MKAKLFACLFVALIALLLFISCDPKAAEPTETTYSTPTIKGKVSIPEGRNISPSEIYVKVIDEEGKTVSIPKAKSDGTFVVENLNTGRKYSILFTSVEPEFTNRGISRGNESTSGVGGWLQDIVPTMVGANDIGNVKLKPLGTIRGKAETDGNNEHYDTTVYIPGTSFIAMTDKDGFFSIYNVPEGTYTLRYTHEGCIPVMEDDVFLSCPDGVEDPEVTVGDIRLVSIFGTVEGIAQFDGLSQHAGISVKLESQDKTQSLQASTSEDGSYVFNNVKPGVYRVIVSASGYVMMPSGYFSVEPATVTTVPEKIVLFKNVGFVRGNVKLSDKQADNTGIVISFVSSEDSFTAVTDKDGNFSKSLRPGVYTVTASFPGYTSRSLDITVVENKDTEFNLPSLPAASGAVAGFVFLSGSEDFSGVFVTLTNSSDSTDTYIEVSAADGAFRFTGLDNNGTYFLTYSKDGYITNNSNYVDVTVGSIADAGSVTLRSSSSTVRGSIELEGASNYEGTVILLRNDDVQYSTTTNQKGEYIINSVRPGTYTLLASKDGYETTSISELSVEPSSNIVMENMLLSIAIRSVVGSVELELSNDFAGVLVTATNLSDNTLIYSAISNSSGNFTLAGMVPGEYRIVMSFAGYNTVTLPTIDVNSSSVYKIEKQIIKIARGSIAGLVRVEGQSDCSGVVVSLLGTEYKAITEKDGSFSMAVPSGNYPGGLRYELDDYETSSYTSTIPVLTNSTYAAPNLEMKAINLPLLEGSLSIKGLVADHYEDIKVYIENLPSFMFTTGSDGKWSMEHVPLGKHTLVFEKENIKKVKKDVYLTPAASIRLDNIELIPDAATIYGYAYLDGMEDNSGITVRATTPDGTDISTVTDSNGYYYLGNMLASKSHEVFFEKEGWNTVSFSIEEGDFQPLDVIDMTSNHPVSLKDTTPPILKSVVANIGRGTQEGREIYLYLFTEDEGSGVKYIYTSLSSDFGEAEKNEYYYPYIMLVPDELGEKTIYVKVEDGTGNSSDIASTNIYITNDKTELYGPLPDDKLHLTKENSPYIVTNNVLVESNKTLVIDPGVEIQIKGDYYIQIEGTLSAVGTETERIKIYGISDGTNNWVGMKFVNENDSVLSYIDITGLRKGINGRCDIDHALITANGWAIGGDGGFTGYLIDSLINGSVDAANYDIKRNVINGEVVQFYNTPFVSGNQIMGNIRIEYASIEGNKFAGECLSTNNTNAFNNKVSTSVAYSANDIQKNTTYIGCDLFLGYYNTYYKDYFPSDLSNIQFINCYFSRFGSDVKDSNFVNCSPLVVFSDRTQREIYDCIGNYWGDINTIEAKSKGEGQNLTFINDYYDDFNKSRIDYSGYRDFPVEDAGYHGTEPEDPSGEYKIGDSGQAGGIVFYDKGFYSDGWRYLEAAPSDVEDKYFIFGFYKPSGTYSTLVGTTMAIGSGKHNTEKLVEYMDIDGKAYNHSSDFASTSEYAAKKCLDYSYGGYDDWFLPSIKELELMYNNLHKKGLGSFSDSAYWSSSEAYDYFVYMLDFSGGSGYLYRSYTLRLRPVRAF